MIRPVTVLIHVTLVVVCAAGSHQAFAQPAPIEVSVVDSDGDPLDDVRAVVRSQSSPDVIEEHATDDRGVFTVAAENFRPGNEIFLQRTGFEDAVLAIGGQHLVMAKIQIRMIRAERIPEAVPPARTAEKASTPVQEYGLSDERKRAIRLYNEGVELWEEANDSNNEEDKKIAEQKFREAASLDPNFAAPHRILCRISMKRENWPETSRYAEDLIRIDPTDTEAIRTLYLSLIVLRHHMRVGEAARRLAAVEPGIIDIIDSHAQEFYKNGIYDMARALYEALVEITPGSSSAYLNLGLCCAALGDVEGTRSAFEAFLEVAPEDHPDRENVQKELAVLNE